MINVRRLIEKRIPATRCEACHKKIEPDEASEVEYVKTKRGTQLFIHKKCIEKVWR